MVYKIVGDLTNENFAKVVEVLKEYNKFIYKNGSIYLALDNYINKEKNEKILSKCFRDNSSESFKNDNLFLIEVNENNLKNECQEVITWCRDEFVRLDRERYEKENQNGLKDMFKVLDAFEENLHKYDLLKLKGKEENNAKQKGTKRRSQRDNQRDNQRDSQRDQ